MHTLQTEGKERPGTGQHSVARADIPQTVADHALELPKSTVAVHAQLGPAGGAGRGQHQRRAQVEAGGDLAHLAQLMQLDPRDGQLGDRGHGLRLNGCRTVVGQNQIWIEALPQPLVVIRRQCRVHHKHQVPGTHGAQPVDDSLQSGRARQRDALLPAAAAQPNVQLLRGTDAELL
ncbi:hypothetical protein D9M68_748750 [compost metagenome]